MGGGVIIPGTIIQWPVKRIPKGFYYCNGRTLRKDLYPDLFNMIQYDYGGSGNDFKIPDYRGYFLRCHDDRDTSRKLGSIQGDTIRNITGKIEFNPNRLMSDARGNWPDGRGSSYEGFIHDEDTEIALTGPFASLGNSNINIGLKVESFYISENNNILNGVWNGFSFDASRSVPTANEVRPKNMTLLYLIYIGYNSSGELVTDTTRL